eukprot:10124607-Alexandrium_andersonii.AAC.1
MPTARGAGLRRHTAAGGGEGKAASGLQPHTESAQSRQTRPRWGRRGAKPPKSAKERKWGRGRR